LVAGKVVQLKSGKQYLTIQRTIGDSSN